MNKIGIYFAYWTKDWCADYPYYTKKVANLGFDILEISTAYMLETSRDKLDEIRKTAEDNKIELTYCVGFSADKDMASENPSVRQNGIEYAKKTLEMIHFMGGKVFGGINYTSWPSTINEGIIDKRPYLERSINSIKQVVKTAEDYDVTYCIEVVNRFEQFLVNTAAEGVAYANEVGSPKLKLLLDVFHMNIEEDNIGEAIITAGDKLGHLHIGECNRKTPGKGHLPWDEIGNAIKKMNYNGRIVMEPFVKMGGEVGRDIKVWRDLSGGADEARMDEDAKDALELIRSKVSR